MSSYRATCNSCAGMYDPHDPDAHECDQGVEKPAKGDDDAG
jgi:hypothetical protein